VAAELRLDELGQGGVVRMGVGHGDMRHVPIIVTRGFDAEPDPLAAIEQDQPPVDIDQKTRRLAVRDPLHAVDAHPGAQSHDFHRHMPP